MLPRLIAQNDDYYVINKPEGYSVVQHRRYPSVAEWLAVNNKEGFIVHRLDVTTSGLLIVAKTARAQAKLRDLWQGRAVKKTYLALVAGEAPKEGSIELAIERDNRRDRMRAALLPSVRARMAITSYKRLAMGEWNEKIKYQKSKIKNKVSLLECHPVTGRTHQIRVHLQSIGHPIIGDRVYGNKLSEKIARLCDIHRQLLHAWKLKLPTLPEYHAALPADMANLLKLLNLDSKRETW